MSQQISRYDRLNLGCGDDHRDDCLNVDAAPECNPDEVVDLEDRPWPWPTASVAEIYAEHVFEHLDDVEAVLRECARILEPGGQLTMRWPIGIDAVADPDHKHVWTWRTPEMYCGERHWDVDVGLHVVDREVNLWSHAPGPIGSVYDRVLDLMLSRHEPGPWCFDMPLTSGEFTVVMER